MRFPWNPMDVMRQRDCNAVPCEPDHHRGLRPSFTRPDGLTNAGVRPRCRRRLPRQQSSDPPTKPPQPWHGLAFFFSFFYCSKHVIQYVPFRTVGKSRCLACHFTFAMIPVVWRCIYDSISVGKLQYTPVIMSNSSYKYNHVFEPE